MNGDFIEALFEDPKMLLMGHLQRREDHNLGLGWIYYALARVIRPPRAVVIGSWRGFAPGIIGRAMLENAEGGEVTFIDPSFVDDFWADPEKVAAHFGKLGAPNVRHHCCTTQAFTQTTTYAELRDIGLLFVDGLHTAEQARFDYLAFLGKLSPEAVVVFHDSVRRKVSPVYGPDNLYTHTVCLLMERLKKTPGLEVFSLPFADGITLVRGRPEEMGLITEPFEVTDGDLMPRLDI